MKAEGPTALVVNGSEIPEFKTCKTCKGLFQPVSSDVIKSNRIRRHKSRIRVVPDLAGNEVFVLRYHFELLPRDPVR